MKFTLKDDTVNTSAKTSFVGARARARSTFSSFLRFLRFSKKTILVIAAAIIITLIVSSSISIWMSKVTNFTFPTIGTIRFRGVEGYWNKNLTNKTEACDWGTIWPGLSKNLTLYLRSISNIGTTLNLTQENWAFRNSNNDVVAAPTNTTLHMNLTWNYNNTTVQPGEVLQVTLTLSVDRSSDFIEFLIANDVKAFSVDIIISASEYR